MTKSCATCSYAEFILTPTGRIKKPGNGKCRAPLPEAIYPQSVQVREWRNGIYPEFGTECNTYKKKA